MERVNTVSGQIRQAIPRHSISETALEGLQFLPIDAQVPANSVFTHSPGGVDRLAAADQHLLWIASPQRTRASEGTMVNDRNLPARGARTTARDPGRTTGTDNDKIVRDRHVRLPSRSPAMPVLARASRQACLAGD